MNKWLAARNILAIRLDNIGDVIMLGPALRAVKETSPQVHLTLLASPGGATPEIVLFSGTDYEEQWRPRTSPAQLLRRETPCHPWKEIQTMYDNIKDYWQELTLVMQMMPFSSLEHAAELLLDCHRREGTVFILGNGGSASTASHFACDLAKGTQTPGLPAFRVIALSDNAPLLTAWANDTSYDRVFAEQLATLV